MIVITGAAGFIGSYLTGYLNEQGISAILAVDDFGRPDKVQNLGNKQVAGIVHRDKFPQWLEANHKRIGVIFHLGARTDTTEFDRTIFDQLNLNYSKQIWQACTRFQIPLIYASSAATYGDGKLGYEDRHDIVPDLRPLNPYGDSKNQFDEWVLKQSEVPPHWHGLKFFNVYGPNEYHKGRMASVIMHAYNQIRKTGKMNLFRSHKAGIADGHQSRDFIYVKDIAKICLYCFRTPPASGLYNAGTGKARTFLDLVNATFRTMDLKPSIQFIDTPLDIRDTYQYFTEANMKKLINAGYSDKFISLEEGVQDYVGKYLLSGGNYY